MKDPNPQIPLLATLEGCKLIITGLRKLPVENVEGLLAEIIGQINTFIKDAEDAEKAEAAASAKAVDTVVKGLRKTGGKKTEIAAAAEAAVESSVL